MATGGGNAGEAGGVGVNSKSVWFVTSPTGGDGWSLHRLTSDGATARLADFNGAPVSLTTDPDAAGVAQALLLLESGEVVQVGADSSQRELGRYSRLLPGRAYTVVAGDSAGMPSGRLLMGHYKGLMEYQPRE